MQDTRVQPLTRMRSQRDEEKITVTLTKADEAGKEALRLMLT